MHHSHDKTTTHICPACDYGAFTRNNYFTGKLLVERDFTDEQRYYVEKLRHHHQRLHGWGVVCGLKVEQHENPACRNRFVLVKPGTAIDCCGHEIVMREPDLFDITQTDAIRSLRKNDDTGRHTLQICIRYRECPTEEIPVLYDECGCDDTQCAPNRILESYDLDVILDPRNDADAIDAPRFQWQNSIALAHSFRAVLHDDASGSLYVMTTDGQGRIFRVSTDNHVVLSSMTLLAKGLALALSNDGKQLYVVTEAATNPTTSKRQLLVLDPTNLGAAPIQALDIEDSVGSDVYLAVAPQPDNRLFALIAKPGKVRIFATGINTSGGNPDPKDVDLGAPNLRGLVIGSDGGHAYVGDPANHLVQVVKVAAPPVKDTALSVLPPTSDIATLAVVRSTGPDLLAVADRSSNKQLHLLALNPPKLIGSSGPLAHEPVALAVSPGGQWMYVLEKDGDKSYVQAVSAQAMQLAAPNEPVKPGAEFEVGHRSQHLVLTTAGDRLYVPYTGDLAIADDGGVAILSVDETACSEILWRHLNGCHQCDVPNCVVLATIENYHLDFSLLNQIKPADPTDEANKRSRINNRKGRRLLPSTEVLTELVECLLEHPAGGAGKQGPVGPQGIQGIQGIAGTNGNDGLGLNPDLPKILDIGWDPASEVNWETFRQRSAYDVDPAEWLVKIKNQGLFPFLTIFFNKRMSGISRQTFRVSLEYPQMMGARFTGLYNLLKLDLYGHILPIGGPVTTPHTSEQAQWAVAFIPFSEFFTLAPPLLAQAQAAQRFQPPLDLLTAHVLLKGDFVFAEGAFDEQMVLDADNIGGQVGINRTRGGVIHGGKNPSGDLAQGGDFESWFFLRSTSPGAAPVTGDILRRSMLDLATGVSLRAVDLNRASPEELMRVGGINDSTARRIVRERTTRPFSSVEDFRSRVRPTATNWNLMRDDISVEPSEV